MQIPVATDHPSGGRLSVPASCPVAVHAFADRQVVREHLERVQSLQICLRSPSALREAVEELVASSTAKAEEVSRKIRGPLRRTQLTAFADLDLMIATPGQIVALPRAAWLLGALASLAAIRAAYWDATARSRRDGSRRVELFVASVIRCAEIADDRWSMQWRQMVLRRPWLRGSAHDVALVGLESAKPSPPRLTSTCGGVQKTTKHCRWSRSYWSRSRSLPGPRSLSLQSAEHSRPLFRRDSQRE
jgi:hypothetical protein